MSQSQIGNDLVGDEKLGRFGSSISLSENGEFMAVGAPGQFYMLCESYTAVYQFRKGDWVQIGQKIGSPEIGDKVGTSVAISGNGKRVAIGIPGKDVIGYNTGIVQVFEFVNDQWIQLGDDLQGLGPIDMFGAAVALSADGSRLAVSAPYNDDGGADAGMVCIYEYDGADWIPFSPAFVGSSPHTLYGRSISLSKNGERIAIGGPGFDDKKGLVDVYVYIGGPWRKLGHSLFGDRSGDNFGVSVTLSENGRRLAVGAPWLGDTEQRSRVTVFQLDHQKWTPLGDPVYGNGGRKDCFGVTASLSADGRLLAVGDPDIFTDSEHKGRIQLYAYAEGRWSNLDSEIHGIHADENAGFEVALSGNGNRLAVGSPNDGEGWSQYGCVRVYDLNVDLYASNPDDNPSTKAFQLFQNAPNPVRLFTNISYEINSPGFVQIHIYNQNGQYIETIDDGYQYAGIHQLEWHPEDLPPGTYLYQMKMHRQSETRMLVLM